MNTHLLAYSLSHSFHSHIHSFFKLGMVRSIINRKRKLQVNEMDTSASTLSDITEIALIETKPSSKEKKGTNKMGTNQGQRNGSLQELHNLYGCGSTLKCMRCPTVFDGTKRMRFHKEVGIKEGQETSLVFKCDHNTRDCKHTTTYLTVRKSSVIELSRGYE